jgi:8-oxo-dGTP diphosphatase
MTITRILFGTTNRGKLEIIRAFLETLPVEVLSLADLNIQLDVPEDGATPEENAEIKARAYYSVARIPTLAIDAALHIRDFPPEKQPGVYVRRINGTTQEVSDQQMLTHYTHELDRIGGQSVAEWKIGLAFSISSARTLVDAYCFEVPILSRPSARLLPGTPLSSLMFDPRSGKYLSEIDHRQRLDAEWVEKIMQRNLGYLDPGWIQ